MKAWQNAGFPGSKVTTFYTTFILDYILAGSYFVLFLLLIFMRKTFCEDRPASPKTPKSPKSDAGASTPLPYIHPPILSSAKQSLSYKVLQGTENWQA